MKKREMLIPVILTGILSSIIYIFFELFPFGNLTLAWCDARQQVVPLLADLKDILAGEQSIFLNLQNAGGMDMWGVLLFFVASPLHLLVAVVPKEGLFDFVNILVGMKMMLCAATSYFYFRKKFPLLGIGFSTVLSVMYAFSGFNLLFYQNVIWLDTAYLFPLLMWGLDRLFFERKPGVYIGVLCAELVVNYYLSYMVVIFLLLYSGIYLMLCCGKEERRARAGVFISASAAAACLTGVIWVPCIEQFADSARGTGLLENLMSSPMLTSLVTTVPLLFCTGIFVPALLFYPYGKIKKKPELLLFLCMAVLMIIPLFLEPVNRIWHTGSYQCFPARYGYMTTFMMLMIGAVSLSRLAGQEERTGEKAGMRLAVGALVSVSVVACLAAFLIPYMQDQREVMNEYTTVLWGNQESFWALALAYGAMVLAYGLCLLLGRVRGLNRPALATVLGGILAIEAFFGGSVYMGYPAADQSGYDKVLDLEDRIRDDGFYRVKTDGKEIEANWMGAAGLPGLSHYTSLTGRDYLFTLKKLGYSAYWMEADSQGGTKFTDALLSNRYTVKYNQEVKYSDVIVYQNERYTIVQNPYSLPAALITTARAQELEQISEGDRFEAQNRLYQMIFDTQEELFIRYEPHESSNLTIDGGRYRIGDSEEIGTLTYYIEVTGRQTLYFDCFGGRYTTRLSEAENGACTILVNNQTCIQSYPAKKENGILELGTFEDESVKIEIRLHKNILPASFGVVGLSEQRMQSMVEEARGTGLEIDGHKAYAYVENGKEGETLWISLPYRDGCEVRVNGEKARLYKALSGFTCLILQEGENRIEITYGTPGLMAGLFLSIVGVLVTLLLNRFWRREPKGYAIVGILPGIWLSVIAAAVYILPVILAGRGL